LCAWPRSWVPATAGATCSPPPSATSTASPPWATSSCGPEILEEGQRALAEVAAGARFQYVFHGSSGSSEAEVHEAVRYGVVKLNVDTDDQYVFTRAIADHILSNYAGVPKVDGDAGRKADYDPRTWGRKAEAAMPERVAAACELVGSAGRSLGS
jgi:fructose-bisphosphate aldolase class II